MRHSLLAVACLGLVAPAAPALAETPINEAAKALVGRWEFSNADRDKRCTITFRTDKGPAGMKLEFDKACPNAFPFVKEIVGWSIGEHDFLRLLDARGRPLLEFSEVESGLYEAPRPGEGILFIQSAAAVPPVPKQPNEMAGDWVVVRRSGQPICSLTLINAAAGPNLALKIKPGCNAFVTRFAPVGWQMDRGELLLKNDRDQSWRFAESDGGTWQRVPESADPLLLVRQ